jgi:hypothetical protein
VGLSVDHGMALADGEGDECEWQCCSVFHGVFGKSFCVNQ